MDDKGLSRQPGKVPLGSTPTPVATSSTETPQVVLGGGKQEPLKIIAPSLGSSKGGSGSLRPIGETFKVNPSNGTMSVVLPIYTSPGRSEFGPKLQLAYDSGSGNGPFGLGWQLEMDAITRKTSNHVPHYDDSDIFMLSGADELVPTLNKKARELDGYIIQEFMPCIATEAIRIELWTRKANSEDTHWRTITGENTTTIFGRDDESRIFDSTTEARKRIFSWLACEKYDAFGNVIHYVYKSEDSQGITSLPSHLQMPELSRSSSVRSRTRYLKSIHYGNKTPNRDLETWSTVAYQGGWLFSVVLDYGEHDLDFPTTAVVKPWPLRKDPFSSRRGGFELRYHRLCRRILMFHHFPNEMGREDCLVRSVSLVYQESENVSFLVSCTEKGHRPGTDNISLVTQALPPYEFQYTEVPLASSLLLKTLDPSTTIGLPIKDEETSEWIDLNGEGSPGLLHKARGGAWTYQRNENALRDPEAENENGFTNTLLNGLGQISRLQCLPNSEFGNVQYFEDIDHDGNLEMVCMDGAGKFGGYYQSHAGHWEDFIPFQSAPSFSVPSLSVTRIDLTGSGLSDLLLMDENTGELVWHESLGKKGFGPEQRISCDKGGMPQIISANENRVVYLADMSGDGLSDIVHVSPGKVSYWPNLTNGLFGDEIVMYNSPRFDKDASFSHARIRLGDVYGTGTADVLYFPSCGGVELYLNLAGNGWSEPLTIYAFPKVEMISEVAILDLMGNGTSCLCWQGPDITGTAGTTLKFVDPTGGQKPMILKSFTNGFGARVEVKYKSSNSYYLQDERRGTPWRTKIGFPVQCVSQVKIKDAITGTSVHSRYAYHDGYFDSNEQEFRGFGMVEQWDTEKFNPLKKNIFRTPPKLTKTWFHTGLAERSPELSRAYTTPSLQASTIPSEMRPGEVSRVFRTFRGKQLREENYSDDGSQSANVPLLITETTYQVQRVQSPTSKSYGAYRISPQENYKVHQERTDTESRREQETVLKLNTFGDILLSASVSYGRLEASKDSVKPEHEIQKQNIIVFTENDYTDRVDEYASYRRPSLYSSRQFRVFSNGDISEFCGKLSVQEVRSLYPPSIIDAFKRATGLSINDEKLAKIQENRTYYTRSNLSSLLPLGKIEEYSIFGQSFDLMSTSEHLDAIYGNSVQQHKSQDLKSIMVSAGYLDLDKNDVWWKPSSVSSHSTDPAQELHVARRSFYVRSIVTDPFKNRHTSTMDSYHLFPVKSTDAVGTITETKYDYVSLTPFEFTDANLNCTQCQVDCFGRTVVVAQVARVPSMGGDSLAGIQSILFEDDVAHFYLKPSLGEAATLIKDAGSRRIYNDMSYFNTKDTASPIPTGYVDITRTFHATSTASSPSENQLMMTFQYMDGKGSPLQTRKLSKVENDSSSTWLVSQWVIQNNKGDPLRTFQPTFSSTHLFIPGGGQNELISATTLYDAVGRSVGRLNANHTFSKVRYGAWSQISYDEGDNVLTCDPTKDPDVGTYFTRLDAESYEPSWYTQAMTRMPGIYDADIVAKREAAVKSETYNDSPSIVHLDSSGREILRITDTGAKKLAIRYEYDLAGNRTRIVDALSRSIEVFEFDLLGRALKRVGMDDGTRCTLFDCMDRKVMEWDDQGWCRRTVYDSLGRGIEIHESQADGTEALIERNIFGDREENAVGRNLKGQLFKVFDQSGVYTHTEYDFKGNCTRSTASFLAEYKTRIDWEKQNHLEDEVFKTEAQFDALNRAFLTVDAKGIMTKQTFDPLGKMCSIKWKSATQNEWNVVVKNVEFTADGMPLRIDFGNGTHQEVEYDAQSRSVLRKQMLKDRKVKLEDNVYFYDVRGSISRVSNQAEKSTFFYNSVVEPSSDYTYDAIGQLITAQGRRQVDASNNGGQGSPESIAGMGIDIKGIPADGSQLYRYLETYQYDDAGNIEKVIHGAMSNGSVSGWTKTYGYGIESCLDPGKMGNLLSQTVTGNREPEKYQYGGNLSQVGCITSMPGSQTLTWSSDKKLKSYVAQTVKSGIPETTWFVYNSKGERVRKITERFTGSIEEVAVKLKETVYLGNAQIYRKYAGNGTVSKERLSHHIKGQDRFAIIEYNVSDGIPGQPLIRYQASPNLELDDQGQVVSYQEYSPFGLSTYSIRRSAVGASRKYRFASYERDKESGLYYCNERYYMAWLGRWISPDPLGTEGGLNLYCYCLNDPINLQDSQGTVPEGCWAKFCAWISGESTAGIQGMRVTTRPLQGQPFYSAPRIMQADLGNGEVSRAEIDLNDSDMRLNEQNVSALQDAGRGRRVRGTERQINFAWDHAEPSSWTEGPNKWPPPVRSFGKAEIEAEKKKLAKIDRLERKLKRDMMGISERLSHEQNVAMEGKTQLNRLNEGFTVGRTSEKMEETLQKHENLRNDLNEVMEEDGTTDELKLAERRSLRITELIESSGTEKLDQAKWFLYTQDPDSFTEVYKARAHLYH